ncbi:MAG: DUF4118 domain-containing protein [Oscillospiraceae bacterium]|nr:DUF4118 domain-containing protein [Oscillospiraceae bacterium]
MYRFFSNRAVKDGLLFLLTIGTALVLSFALAAVNDDNNPFAMAVFILAVVLIARVTKGYYWGIAASLIGTFCVNYFFTYPFWTFSVNYPGYPLTMAVMLIASILISTLTTRIKQQEQLHLEVEREKMHANLLRAISHDIRTPLASILGASSALQEQNLTRDAQKELISGIQRDAKWLVRVTENLLSVTKLSNGAVKLKEEDEVLEEIIGSAILKYHQSEDSLPVSVDAPGEIIIVPMDAMLIEQVLVNLFENVSIHAADATKIWLHVSRSHNTVRISVEDDGPGIPNHLLSCVKDGTMIHSEQQPADAHRNMGIGLSVCRSIILAHGGSFAAEKSIHGGAALCIDLPCKEETYVEQSAQ